MLLLHELDPQKENHLVYELLTYSVLYCELSILEQY